MPVSNVFNQDCMIGMKETPDKYYELAVVDPPYGIGADKNMAKNDGKWGYKKRGDTNWDFAIPNENYFTQLFRISKNQIIWGGNYFQLRPTPCYIIWDKVQRIDQADCELAWTSFETSCRVFEYARGNESGFAPKVSYYLKQYANIHPTQKPVALYQWLLKNYAQPGDHILDTHMGSQSSRIAAYKMGFDYTGYEIDPDYFKDGNARFEKAIAEPLFDVIKPPEQKELF